MVATTDRFTFASLYLLYWLFIGLLFSNILSTAIFRRRFDFQSPNKTESNVEMFSLITEAVQRADFWKIPHVFIRPEVDRSRVAELREIVTRRQGVLVDNEADATHILYDFPPTTESERYRAALANFFSLFEGNI